MIPSFTPFHRGGSGTPMVCIHGFTGTWRAWDLVLPRLEQHHDVLAPTLPGHAGGPRLAEPIDPAALAESVERAMDAAGFERAHVVGNSLGGHVALQLAARGRAETVVVLAPAGGWADGDTSYRETLDYFTRMRPLLKAAAPNADAILSTVEGRRRATIDITTSFEHIPVELLVHQLVAAAACPGAEAMIANAHEHGWPVDLSRVRCPVRVVWGTEDRLLHWPRAAARFRDGIPQADWVVLDGVGHCPQLDVPAETAELILEFAVP